MHTGQNEFISQVLLFIQNVFFFIILLVSSRSRAEDLLVVSPNEPNERHLTYVI